MAARRARAASHRCRRERFPARLDWLYASACPDFRCGQTTASVRLGSSRRCWRWRGYPGCPFAAGPAGDRSGHRVPASCDPASAMYRWAMDTRPKGSVQARIPVGYVAECAEPGSAVRARLCPDKRCGPRWRGLEQTGCSGLLGTSTRTTARMGRLRAEGQPSKWVTLRACRVLKQAFG